MEGRFGKHLNPSRWIRHNTLFLNSLYLECRQRVVSQSTGCDSPLLFEEIYSYYAQAEAWYVAPGAQAALQRLKDSGEDLSLLEVAHVSCYQHRI